MNSMRRGLKQLGRRLKLAYAEEEAVTATEYAVILALILLVCLAAISTFGQSVNNLFSRTNNIMPDV
jgi:pilus assembly protein Flp/PilA